LNIRRHGSITLNKGLCKVRLKWENSSEEKCGESRGVACSSVINIAKEGGWNDREWIMGSVE
jgi:hypothetical protein